MPNVTVNPVQTVSVRVNPGVRSTVKTTSTFVGSGDATEIAIQARATANLALTTAENANTTATLALVEVQNKVSKTGDTMSGALIINNDLTLANNFYGTIDGGTFS